MMGGFFGAIELVVLFAFGYGSLGVPPLPEDPLLSRAAPQDCLWYLSSAGMAEPRADSANETEQLLAEPELVRFTETVERKLRSALIKNARGRNPETWLAMNVPGFVKVMITRPWAVYVSDVQVGPNGPAAHAGLVVNAGENVARVRQKLEELEELIFRGQPSTIVEEAGVSWRRLPTPEQAPPVLWAARGRYIMFCIGEGEPTALLERAETDPPQWLSDLKNNAAIERVSMVGYLNLQGIAETALPFAGPMRENIEAALQSAGLANVEALESVSGLNETGYVASTLLRLKGDPSGLFTAFPDTPLTADDLQHIPEGAKIAVAGRIEPAKLMQTARDTARQIDPRAAQQFDQVVARIEEQLGFQINGDLLDSLGQLWTLHLGGGETLLSWSDLLVTVEVEDREKLQRIHDQLINKLRSQLPLAGGDGHGRRRGVTIRDFTFQDERVYFVNVIGEEMPVAPAWCLTESKLVFGLFPQAVKNHLLRGDDSASLAEHPAVSAALAGDNPPFALATEDTKALFEALYPLALVGGQMLASELQEEGIDIDISVLPAPDAISRHLDSSITTWTHTDSGIAMVRHSSVPLGGGVATALPIAASLMVPAGFRAQLAAKEIQEINHLKQIGLAMHNYAAAHNHFPPAVITDDDGKPLYSWRVAILPYIEQNAMYEEFHLDEPWDSEHNKKFLDKMPAIYASPLAELPEGKTRYVVLQGEGTFFSPKGESTKFSDIRDGLSNTLMAVTASPKAAVPWTKPEDIDFDSEKPTQGIVENQPRGGFGALFGDGHVRRLSVGIGADTLKAIATRAGEERVSSDDLDAQPRRGIFGGHAVEKPAVNAEPANEVFEEKSEAIDETEKAVEVAE